MPSVEKLEALCGALDLEFRFGAKRPTPETTNPVGDFLEIASGKTLPHHGMAECGLQGWGGDDTAREDIARPAWVSDDQAFWVSATGQSMEPEGIRDGDFCLVSPGRAAKPGDRVWIREATRDPLVTIKRLIDLTPNKVTLRGWLPPEDGKYRDFIEERTSVGVAELFPVIGVYRGRLGKAGVDVEFIPDPRKGQNGRNDGLVPVSLLADSAPGKLAMDFPTALGFPEAWLKRQGVRPGSAALVAVTDDALEPTVSKGAVVLVSSGFQELGTKGLFAVRRNGTVVVRRLEKLANGTLLLSGDNPSARTSMVPPDRRKSVEVVGKVIWVSSSFN